MDHGHHDPAVHCPPEQGDGHADLMPGEGDPMLTGDDRHKSEHDRQTEPVPNEEQRGRQGMHGYPGYEVEPACETPRRWVTSTKTVSSGPPSGIEDRFGS